MYPILHFPRNEWRRSEQLDAAGEHLTVDIQIKDIPDVVLDDIACSLKNYLVPMYVLSPKNREHHFRFVGSGTLVEIKGTHHVLTAAHVWSETKDAEEIGFVLTDYPSSFRVLRDGITAKQLWDGKISEWGPDLALLELPAASISTISAIKSFVNLSQERESLSVHPISTEKGLWTVTGMVGEFSSYHQVPQTRIVEATAVARAFFSVMEKAHQSEEYDYLDLSAKMELSGVPQKSFCGVSGGGLWELELSMSKSGEISWKGKRHFRGVAFWETAISSDGQRAIRCHGPRSIFEKAWEAWALPKAC